MWVTKTHFPWSSNPENAFTASKLVYITRHPVDVFASHATLMFAKSHSMEPLKPWNEYKVWPHFIKNSVGQYRDFHAYIHKQSEKTPTFFLTYEDLVFNQEATIKQLFSFMLDVESVEGTVIAGKIAEYCNKGFKQK